MHEGLWVSCWPQFRQCHMPSLTADHCNSTFWPWDICPLDHLNTKAKPFLMWWISSLVLGLGRLFPEDEYQLVRIGNNPEHHVGAGDAEEAHFPINNLECGAFRLSLLTLVPSVAESCCKNPVRQYLSYNMRLPSKRHQSCTAQKEMLLILSWAEMHISAPSVVW